MNRRNLLSSIFTGAGLGAVASTSAQSASEAMERDPLLANIGELRFAEDPDPSNPLSINSREHLNHYVQHGTFIPNLELLNQEGQTVHFYEDCVKGKIVLINFMYTKCRGKCPRATRNLTEVQKLLGERLGKDFHFLSISIDPEEDKPEVLKAYMELYEIKSGWTFLTGKRKRSRNFAGRWGSSTPILSWTRTGATTPAWSSMATRPLTVGPPARANRNQTTSSTSSTGFRPDRFVTRLVPLAWRIRWTLPLDWSLSQMWLHPRSAAEEFCEKTLRGAMGSRRYGPSSAPAPSPP